MLVIKKNDSIIQLQVELKGNKIRDGERVRLKCKPSPFGPYLRNHFLSPIIGNHTNLRLGPPILSQNPLMGVIAQTTSQLMPVGLFPPLENNMQQICLYPVDTSAYGFISSFLDVSNLVPYIPAIARNNLITSFNKPCYLTGNMRLINLENFTNAGFSSENFELIRQLGNIWFLDASSDEVKCKIIDNIEETELWGGLYASGHLEYLEGELPVSEVVDALNSALTAENYKTKKVQNKAQRKEIVIFSKGIRILLDTKAPFYSIHMDSELAKNYDFSRKTFNNISRKILKNLSSVCKSNSIDLLNPHDLDFSYTDSEKSFTVLQSRAANNIKDPLAIAVRDWHRKRCKEMRNK